MVSIGEVIDTVGRMAAKVSFSAEEVLFRLYHLGLYEKRM
jgi:hypothetical protein